MHRIAAPAAAGLCLLGLMAQEPAAPKLPEPSKAPVDFARDVQPILAKRCFACHGPGQQMAGLRLDDSAAALKGTHTGPVILPGKSAESKLIHRIASTKKGFAMPPMGERLADADIAVLRAWIDQGAKMPAVSPAAAQSAARPGHWSFQPIRRPDVPQVKKSSWVRNPIDAFVLARLEAASVEPSPEAKKTTLIRRVSLDLTGLPPTPAEIDAVLNDTRPDAYERYVDSLLASPHYGERWARHWLDLARYADSDGYEKDLVRPYAWRYRNWVINALNDGMPFDQFTIEQLAGDLLPNATVEQRVATGFHRNVLTNREAGVDRAEARFEQDVNRTNTVSTVWLGLTTGCAQCHNHKFDPISQKEYYQLFAYSRGVEESDIEAPLPGEIGPYMRARPEYDRRREAILKEYNIPAMQAESEKKLLWTVEHPGEDLEWDFVVTGFKGRYDNAVKTLRIPPENRTLFQRELMTEQFIRGTSGVAYRHDEAKLKAVKEAKEKLEKLDASFTPLTHAMTVVEDVTAPKTYIAVGGDYRTKGPEVEPGVPAVLGGAAPKTRLEFARWLVSKDNPLTARVIANQIWGEFFGRAIVRTTEDFGTQGDRPTHPELLDWLASDFRDNGWKVKRLQKQIVMSATYRQSSEVRKELLSKDPDNSMLARQSRLRMPAERIRDAALAASGLLNPQIGGRSVRPPLPAGIAELGYGNSVKWAEDKGPERYRRGLYIHFQRTTPYPMLMTFDAPDSNVACTRRSRSNTSLQALNLLNDPVFVEAAQALAYRLLNERSGSAADRIDYAFRLCIGRSPNEREKQRLSSYFDQQIGILRKDPSAAASLLTLKPDGVDAVEAAAWVGVSRVLLNLDEFITRE
jgi:mono/diheme cytochrome c family protein